MTRSSEAVDVLLSDRRRACMAIAGGLLSLRVASAKTKEEPGPREVSVLDFGADASGRSDSTAAFAAAFSKSDAVFVPAGTYSLGTVPLRQGLRLRGDGERSILVQRPESSAVLLFENPAFGPSPDAALMSISNLQLRGASDTLGFAEHVHLLTLLGAANVRIADVTFRGFRGDGLYLGGKSLKGEQRHNAHIEVENCVFDGVNHENRNGLSVIDCDGLQVSRCTFRNVTRKNMPGAIDMEPDADRYAIVRNIHIFQNHFESIGGNVGAVSMYIPILLDAMPSNIVIEDNTLQNVTAAVFSLRQAVPPSKDAPDQGIVVRNNKVSGSSSRPFDIRGVVGVELAGNQFLDSANAGLVGYRESTSFVRHLALRGNSFARVGNNEGVGIAVFSVQGLLVSDNTFEDCGNGSSTSYVFDFNAGLSTQVAFRHNTFTSPLGRSKYVIQKETGHQFDARSNVFASDNVVQPGLKSAFEAAGAK